MTDFIGVKAALLLDNEVAIIQRDNKPGLPFAGLWDLPGGGREGNESPFECAAREVQEELGIHLTEDNVLWQKPYPSLHNPSQTAYFMVIKVTDTDINSIVLGDEGQGWRCIALTDFVQSSVVVEPLKRRLQDFIASGLSG